MHYMPEEGCPWYGRIQHTRTITTTVIPTAISLLCHMIVQWMKERSSTMTTDARTCWYQKHDLLACAARHGFSVTESRFDEWVERGLMGEAQMRVWPGRGSHAWWSHAQLTLFLDLLAFRQRTSSTFPFRQLFHLPVWRWLYWGSLGGVTLKQVKRALSTWVDLHVTRGMRQYQGPKAADIRPLIDEYTRIMTFHKPVERDVLQHLLDPVVNAYPKRAAKGPVRTWMDPADVWSLMMSLSWEVVRDKALLPGLPDAFWEWARCFVLIGPALLNGEDRARLANDPVLGALFQRQTVHSLRFQSCQALLTWLGMATQRELAPWHLPAGRFLDPEAWQQGEVTWTHETHIGCSPLVLPGGKPIPYLCNTITLSYRERQQPFAVALPFL